MKLGDVGHIIHSSSVSFVSLCRAAVAGMTGALLFFRELNHTVRNKAGALKTAIAPNNKQAPEVITMKKSTLVALFAALAAVAGVLGALYVYVLRREKELDEYEQLLFSEDFDDDDISDSDLEALLAESEEDAKKDDE